MLQLNSNSTLYRHLPERLQTQLRSVPKWFNMSYVVGRQGNFTVVVVNKDKKPYFGVAKRDPNSDKEDFKRGIAIAGSRAISRILNATALKGGKGGRKGTE